MWGRPAQVGKRLQADPFGRASYPRFGPGSGGRFQRQSDPHVEARAQPVELSRARGQARDVGRVAVRIQRNGGLARRRHEPFDLLFTEHLAPIGQLDRGQRVRVIAEPVGMDPLLCARVPHDEGNRHRPVRCGERHRGVDERNAVDRACAPKLQHAVQHRVLDPFGPSSRGARCRLRGRRPGRRSGPGRGGGLPGPRVGPQLRLDPALHAACHGACRGFGAAGPRLAQERIADAAAEFLAQPAQQPALLPLAGQVQAGQHGAGNQQQRNLQFGHVGSVVGGR